MILDRDTLKAFFKQGSKPTEKNFSDLIDSMYNKKDDDVLSEYIENTAITNDVFAEIKNSTKDGFSFINAQNNSVLMNISAIGNVAIGKTEAKYKLDVNGTISSPSRAGSYIDPKINSNEILADGKWHQILTNLDGLNIFEVTASAKGDKGKGEYALLHAVAMSAYGKSKNKIIQHSARYKGLFHNICLRWTGSTNSYNLEIRTSKNFGNNEIIHYFITKIISEND
jgi:hypothetical protein